MRIIAFVLDRPTVERILEHIGVIGGRTAMPAVKDRLPPVGRRPTADAAAGGRPARSPPQLEFGFDQAIATADWPEMDQTAGQGADGWE